MKSRLLSTLLALTLVFSAVVVPSAYAASDEAIAAAEALHELGLLNGSGTNADGSINYELDRAPTRFEAVTMLVRLLGKEEEAKSREWEIPFTDISAWAAPYVGYAYNNSLTSGTSATTYSGDEIISATQYLTFVLRALGYESGVDFSWNKAWELTDKLGITHGEYSASSIFTRGDVALVSKNTLEMKKKGGETFLFEPSNLSNTESKILSPHYIKISNNIYELIQPIFLYICDGGIVYVDTRSHIIGENIANGYLAAIVALSEGLFGTSVNDNPFLSGNIFISPDNVIDLNSNGFVLNKMVEYLSAVEKRETYTYEYNGKSISTPDFTESEKTVDGVHFIKMDDTYIVKVNDFLAYFGIDKTMSLETLDGEYCLVVE